MKLTPDKRKKMPAKEFAGPNKSFPLNDKVHDRMAISGATRSERAGNISPAEADKIKAEARAKLHGNAKGPTHSTQRDHDKFLHHITP